MPNRKVARVVLLAGVFALALSAGVAEAQRAGAAGGVAAAAAVEVVAAAVVAGRAARP